MRDFNPTMLEELESRRLLSGSGGPAGQLAFAFSLGQAELSGVATDGQNNVYVAGHFKGTVDFNPARRRTYNLSAIAEAGDPFVAKYSSAGGLCWAEHIGVQNRTPGRRDIIESGLTADRAGNVYLTGEFEQATDFDPGTGVNILTPRANADGDAYLLALDTAGGFRFANRIPPPGTRATGEILRSGGMQIATDTAGHVYLLVSIKAGDQRSMVLTKSTRGGRTLWTRSFVGDDTTEIYPLAMTADASGDTFIAGQVYGVVDFDPSAAIQTVRSGDHFTLKLTPQGDLAWLGGIKAATVYSLAADEKGNLYEAGGYSGTVDFDFSSRKSFILTSVGVQQDGFLARYSSTGALDWARSMGGSLSDGAGAVQIATDGTIYAAGQFAARAYFNPGRSRFKLSTPAKSASFIAAFSPAGLFLNAWQIAPSITNVNALNSGELIFSGLLLSPGDVDPGFDVYTLNPVVAGLSNLFLLKLK